jgi:hypothetical protein
VLLLQPSEPVQDRAMPDASRVIVNVLLGLPAFEVARIV